MKAIRSINAKAKSQRGASLPLVLLLFLICAVTASIVMTAGTAAAGRAAGLSESDQAYYSVTSAADLFLDELAGDNGEGHKVKVTVMRTVSSGLAAYQVTVDTDDVVASTAFSLLERAALCLLFGAEGCDSASAANEAANSYFTDSTWSTWTTQTNLFDGKAADFDLTHPSSDLDSAQQQALSLTGRVSTDAGGNLIIRFNKADANSGSDVAALTIRCEASIEGDVVQPAESEGDTEIKSVTVTWKPSALKKG